MATHEPWSSACFCFCLLSCLPIIVGAGYKCDKDLSSHFSMEPEPEQMHQEDMLTEEDYSSTMADNGSVCQEELDQDCDEEELLAGDPAEDWRGSACWTEAIDQEELLKEKVGDSRRQRESGRTSSRRRTRLRRRQRHLSVCTGKLGEQEEPRHPPWLDRYFHKILSEIYEMKRSLPAKEGLGEAFDGRLSHRKGGGTVVFSDSQTWELMRKKGGACIPGERGTRLIKTNLDARTEIGRGSLLVHNVIVLCGTEDYWLDQNVWRAAFALESFVQTARMRFPCANLLVSSLLHRDHSDQVEFINRRLARLCREHSRLVLVDNRGLHGSPAFQRDGFTLSTNGLVGLLKNVRLALDWL